MSASWVLLGSRDRVTWTRIASGGGGANAAKAVAVEARARAFNTFRLVVDRSAPGSARAALKGVQLRGFVLSHLLDASALPAPTSPPALAVGPVGAAGDSVAYARGIRVRAQPTDDVPVLALGPVATALMSAAEPLVLPACPRGANFWIDMPTALQLESSLGSASTAILAGVVVSLAQDRAADATSVVLHRWHFPPPAARTHTAAHGSSVLLGAGGSCCTRRIFFRVDSGTTATTVLRCTIEPQVRNAAPDETFVFRTGSDAETPLRAWRAW